MWGPASGLGRRAGMDKSGMGTGEKRQADGVLAGAVDGVEGQGVDPAFGSGGCDAALLGKRRLLLEVVKKELDVLDCGEEVHVDGLEARLVRWREGVWCDHGGEERAVCDAGVGCEDGDAEAPVECFWVCPQSCFCDGEGTRAFAEELDLTAPVRCIGADEEGVRLSSL